MELDTGIPSTEGQALELAARYSRLSALLSNMEASLKAYARDAGGFSYGGELVNGKMAGALHIYDQRTVFQLVPDRQIVAEYFESKLQPVDRQALIEELLLKIRTDWFMSWFQKREDQNQIRDFLKAADPEHDGLRTEYGEYSTALRVNPPDANVEMRKPQEEPDEQPEPKD